jgi:FkbM family methyltransferase
MVLRHAGEGLPIRRLGEFALSLFRTMNIPSLIVFMVLTSPSFLHDFVVRITMGHPSTSNRRLGRSWMKHFKLKFRCQCGYIFKAGIEDYWRFTSPFEPLTYLALIEKASPRQLVVDVGAHVGWYTIHLARTTKRVIALEPNFDNLTCLQENVRINGLMNVTIVPAAVSDYNGEGTLYEHRTSGGHSLIGSESRPTGHSVAVLRLDKVISLLDLTHIALIKMDVEGAEPLAIKGLGKCLDPGFLDALLVEISKPNLKLLEELKASFPHVEKLDNWELVATNYLFSKQGRE